MQTKLPKWHSSKGLNSVKINSSSIRNAYAHFHYVHNKYKRFEIDPIKIGGVDYTKPIPYNAKMPRTTLFVRASFAPPMLVDRANFGLVTIYRQLLSV